ncbi:MAG: class I SAM-dependent methyltransferase [Opitutaceae bacterium]|nr:class I SAM-dependent methyltransferase [Cephaloticoccus sp.]MCP5529988.1 class I SAM-dependent methyltransferase [Opitutaceae bacterium]
MSSTVDPVRGQTVRDDFNDVRAVVHYTKAAHGIGLWESERVLIERFFPDKSATLLEAGCGAGRVSVALWEAGYQHLHAFDFAEELLAQAHSLALERNAALTLFHADATRLAKHPAVADLRFDGALFMFNGLMQIPLRRNRRRALRNLATLCVPGAPLLFTTHDRDDSAVERALWRLEAMRWAKGKQDPILREFGDRYYEEDGVGRTFMHLPVRDEILADLKATGWVHEFDEMRRRIAAEPRKVRDFSDECRFWVARRA